MMDRHVKNIHKAAHELRRQGMLPYFDDLIAAADYIEERNRIIVLKEASYSEAMSRVHQLESRDQVKCLQCGKTFTDHPALVCSECVRPGVSPGWVPTPENVNALPEPLRRYVMHLETVCDPAGDLRELVIARDTIAALGMRPAVPPRSTFG